MKKLTLTFLSFIFAISTTYSQKGIDFNKKYPGGGKLLMSVDSSAKNIFYSIVFPNQPNATFNYLPEVNNINFQINFRKTNNIENYRYTILIGDNPIAVNKSINKTQLNETHAGGDEEVFNSLTLGNFPIKGKVITLLVYSIEKPLDIDKSVFYAKPIPKAKIKSFSKRFKTDKGVDYSWIPNPKENTDLTFSEEDDELTIVKERSEIDYLYSTSIKDKQTNKIIFNSTTWQYGGIVERNGFLPYLKIDRSLFRESGEYEIIIQPSIKLDGCLNCDISAKEIEEYTARYKISVTLEEEKFFSTKQLISSGLLFSLIAGAITGGLAVYIKNQQIKKKVAAEAKQKELAQLQLNSVRSQLNPHFLFNALAGIQNLMNKNEIDHANRYLSKFARLTRNVLDSKELISLTEEKTLLDDYLQMEKLRFGFQYKINAAAGLDTDNIEIPAMLLQPFVENAVKHGIAEKGNEGKIEISFEKNDADLILKITDSGKGFDEGKAYNGLGLALSKNRISLLNTIYKDTPFILDIQSDANGTTVTITLTQWL